ncbi:Phosphatidylglycerophosphatase A [Aquimixticola soesokkakensis]|uniref:Phosphatidylglycerophosphatase A n=1 Tax=Aquimixticola soesokkakensis TaxID=1519096 RepID=A0A1Y5SJS6_9RHOB|nr:phosphatidylglycerophosphatase A [Aquimixticola soesokkakensis]SLN41769.1 Phosphatidylglycerophosphatase A [Aquimixticola soesokkakensis]
MNGFAKMIATFFGVGNLTPAPGTWGSFVALPVLYALHSLGGFPLVLVATLAVTLLGIRAISRYLETSASKDPSEVVIDEVAGQFIALWPVSLGATMMGADVTALWPGWLVAFLAFRLFDIWKPGPVGWADRRGDALGVMLDDLIAGAMAAVVVIIAAGAAHGLMMR